MRKLKMFDINNDEVRKIRLKLIEILLIIGGIIGGIELKSEINVMNFFFVLFLVFAIYYYIIVSNKIVKPIELIFLALVVAIFFSIIIMIPFYRNIDNMIIAALVPPLLLILSVVIFAALYQDFSEDQNVKKSITPEEKIMNSNENESNLDKCPLSVENWIMFLNNEIRNQTYPDFTTMISPIMIFSISLLGFMIDSIDNPTQEFFASIWRPIWTVLVASSAVAVIYFVIDFFKTHTKIKNLTIIRDNTLSGKLTDSNQIHEEWKNLGN